MTKKLLNLIYIFGSIIIFTAILYGCSNSSTASGKEEIIKKDADFVSKSNFASSPLIITFNKAELRIASALTNEDKTAKNIPQDVKYYVNIEYDVKNPTSSMYGWNGFDTLLIDGQQINIGSENFGEVKGNEIEANATIKNNTIKIAADKNAKEIKLLPAEALKDNSFTGDEPEFTPNPIIINLK